MSRRSFLGVCWANSHHHLNVFLILTNDIALSNLLSIYESGQGPQCVAPSAPLFILSSTTLSSEEDAVMMKEAKNKVICWHKGIIE